MSGNESSAPKIVFAGGCFGSADFPVHHHENAWELLYLREGSISQVAEKEVLGLSPGMFVLHPPGTKHGDIADSEYFLYHLLLTSGQPLSWPRMGRDLEGEPIGALLGLIVRDWYSGWIHRDAFLRHSMGMLNILMRRCQAQMAHQSLAISVVSEARSIFRQEFRGPINLAELAIRLGISRSTLYAYFDQVLGRTPQEVLDDIRMKHAVFLLQHSELSVESVATGSGFCSSSHLGRKLRKSHQMTAREIRDPLRKAGAKP